MTKPYKPPTMNQKIRDERAAGQARAAQVIENVHKKSIERKKARRPRQLLAAGVATVALLGAGKAVDYAGNRVQGDPVEASNETDPYTVKHGDTPSQIVEEQYDVKGNPAPLVDAISDAAGGTLEVGEHINIPDREQTNQANQ